jgi:hypothetical protein
MFDTRLGSFQDLTEGIGNKGMENKRWNMANEHMQNYYNMDLGLGFRPTENMTAQEAMDYENYVRNTAKTKGLTVRDNTGTRVKKYGGVIKTSIGKSGIKSSLL